MGCKGGLQEKTRKKNTAHITQAVQRKREDTKWPFYRPRQTGIGKQGSIIFGEQNMYKNGRWRRGDRLEYGGIIFFWNVGIHKLVHMASQPRIYKKVLAEM